MIPDDWTWAGHEDRCRNCDCMTVFVSPDSKQWQCGTCGCSSEDKPLPEYGMIDGLLKALKRVLP